MLVILCCGLVRVEFSEVLGRSRPCIYFRTSLGSCSVLDSGLGSGLVSFRILFGVLHFLCLLSNDSSNVNLSKSISNLVELLNLSFFISVLDDFNLLYLSNEDYLFNSSCVL
jgi:hypothetical protein